MSIGTGIFLASLWAATALIEIKIDSVGLFMYVTAIVFTIIMLIRGK